MSPFLLHFTATRPRGALLLLLGALAIVLPAAALLAGRPAVLHAGSGRALRTQALRATALGMTRPLTNTATFTDVSSLVPGLPQVYQGSVAWGDFDNDGRLDFLLTGLDAYQLPVSRLYQNTGTGFIDASNLVQGGLPQVGLASIAWGDFDNDGRLDFLLTGDSGGFNPRSKLYRNTGTGFVDASNLIQGGLPQVFVGGVAWGDFDNDGRLDFLLTGVDVNLLPVTRLYRNTGSGFIDASNLVQGGLPQVNGSVAWGDFDNDGRLDFLLSGYTGSGGLSRLYQNTGSGFIDASNLVQGGLPQVHGSVAWGDYDNDGRLDFLLTGDSGAFTSQSKLYRNTGSGFIDASDLVQGGLPQVNGSVAWGDFDNDGRLDFLLTGEDTNSSRVSRLYQNTGSGFVDATDLVQSGLPQVASSSVAWGDFGNDGRLDFLLTGEDTNSSRVSRLYQNAGNGIYVSKLFQGGAPPNTPPGRPSGLQATQVDLTSALLVWNAVTDTETLSNTGLSYNLRVGSAPGASDILGPMANTSVLTETTGLRRLPALGNARPNLSRQVTGLQPGTIYYWSVQAIDPGWMGGAFAAEGRFTTRCLGCPTATPTPAPSSTPYPTYTPGPSSTPYPTHTAGPSSTPYPTYTPGPSATAGPSSTPYPTDTPEPSSTPYPTYTPPPTQTPGGPSATPPPSATPAGPTATATACTLSFSDVHPADYFYAPVQFLACRGVISGYADGTFRPYNNTTRAQMVKIVVLGFGKPIVTPASGQYTFADVPPSFPFFPYIETAVALNIVSGYTCGGPGEPCDGQHRPYFRPYANVTRSQLAKIDVLTAGWPLLDPPAARFADVPPGGAFYQDVETAAAHNIISGYTCGGPGESCDDQQRPYFRLYAQASRGQIAKIVYLSLPQPLGRPGLPTR